MATVLIYLSAPEEGGETVFPLEGEHGLDRLPTIDYRSCDQGLKVDTPSHVLFFIHATSAALQCLNTLTHQQQCILWSGCISHGTVRPVPFNCSREMLSCSPALMSGYYRSVSFTPVMKV